MDNHIVSGLDAFLIFQLGDEKFAVNIGYVRRILGNTVLTRVPHAPDEFLGVMNLAGEVIPVIDGRLKFGLPKKEAGPDSGIVILLLPGETGVNAAGLLVDRVLQVVDIPEECRVPPPETGSRLQHMFIRSVARLKDTFVLILNEERLFGQGDLVTTATNI